MQISKHAFVRMQQRAVSPKVIQFLEHYGRRVHDGRQGVIVHFDKRARSRIQKNMGAKEFAGIEKKLDAYLIEVDGKVITVGYRYKRVHRH